MNKVTEAELTARAVAPRVTLEQVEASILSEHYFTAADGVDGSAINELRAHDAYKCVTITPLKDDPPLDGTPIADLGLLTFCVLRLQNGYTVHGVSACADPANYNRDIGERIARANAVNQIWPLLGFELKTRLSQPRETTIPYVLPADAFLSFLQGADLAQGEALPQAGADSPSGPGEATGV